ncbi:MAG TPA: helix-turn-helix transcriptional regulator [Pirellulales bacterium]|jgi:transcriptional regulator with XRE-family HTH domain|nr:helix-turn-helix transcriptional regulator [Pirellulales bacterium]
MLMSVLSERIRELREQKNLTVRRFADALEKTPGYISRVEGRGEIPSPELLCKMAKVLGAKPEELLELAKESQLRRVEEDIRARHSAALNLFRKGKR